MASSTPKRRSLILLISLALDIVTITFFGLNGRTSSSYFDKLAMYRLTAPELSRDVYLEMFWHAAKKDSDLEFYSIVNRTIPTRMDILPSYDLYYNKQFITYNSTETDHFSRYPQKYSTYRSYRNIDTNFCYRFLVGYVPSDLRKGIQNAFFDYKPSFTYTSTWIDCDNKPLQKLSNSSKVGVALWSVAIFFQLLNISLLISISNGGENSVGGCVVVSYTLGLLLTIFDTVCLFIYARYIDRLVQYLINDYKNLVAFFQFSGLNPEVLPVPITLKARMWLFVPLITGVLRFGMWQVGIYLVWLSKDTGSLPEFTWYENLEKKFRHVPPPEPQLTGRNSQRY